MLILNGGRFEIWISASKGPSPRLSTAKVRAPCFFSAVLARKFETGFHLWRDDGSIFQLMSSFDCCCCCHVLHFWIVVGSSGFNSNILFSNTSSRKYQVVKKYDKVSCIGRLTVNNQRIFLTNKNFFLCCLDEMTLQRLSLPNFFLTKSFFCFDRNFVSKAFRQVELRKSD